MRINIETLGVLLIGICLGAPAQTTTSHYSVSRVAGAEAPTGDGGPATQALLRWVHSVSVDRSGNVFIVEENRVRKVTWDGKITTVAGIGGRYGYSASAGGVGDGGPAVEARLCYPWAAVPDNAGNLYIADGCGRVIRSIGWDGIIRTIAGTGSDGKGWTGDNGPAVRAQIGRPRGIALDGNGNLYFTDTENHVVRKIDRNGIITTIAGTGQAGYNGDGLAAVRTQLASPHQIAVDAAGSIFIADMDNNMVRRITPDGIMRIVAGNRDWGFGGDNGPATAAQLDWPMGVAVDSTGNIYIADSANHRIRKVSAAGIISTVAGNGTRAFSGDDGPALGASLATPQGLAVTADGDLYIADSNNHRLRKLNLAGGAGTITTVAGSSNARGDGGSALDAVLFGPDGLARDAQGNLYFADYENNRIRKINPAGVITTVAGGNKSGFGGDDGPAANALLDGPWGTAMAPDGSLYFTDSWNDRIRKITPTGIISTVAGSGRWWDPLGDGGAAKAANIWNPRYLALDASGNLYVTTLNRVRKISTAGTISTIAGVGEKGFAGDGGLATSARLNNPWGVAVDEVGVVYVADRSNHVIRSITPGGVINTVAGVGGKSGFSGDGGPGVAANLSWPSEIALDGQGNLLILDEGNCRIRLLRRDGIITTIAGTGELGKTGDGGAALQARFGWPRGVALDRSGNIYISDEYYDVIRKLSPLVAARLEIAGGNNQSADAGKRVPLPLRVKVMDALGIPVPGVTVSFAVTSGAAKLATEKAVTGINGEASVDLTLGPAAGRVTVAARVTGLGEVVFQLTALEVIPPTPPKVTEYTISTLAGNYASGEGGPANAAQLNAADGMAVDAAGNVYFSDRNRHRVLKVSPDGIMSAVAGTGVEGYGGDGGPATAARLYLPSGVALDANGNLLVADAGNHRVRLIGPDGVIRTFAGSGAAGAGGDGGPASRAQLRNPMGVAVGADGTVFIADTDNHRIRGVAGDGTINSVAGTGTAGYGGDGGPAAQAQLRNPSGLASDSAGSLYLADRGNHRIRRVDSSGVVETLAGNGTAGFTGDAGPAKDAQLNTPHGVALDAGGSLYIADWGNHRVRRVTTGGVISTLAGTGAAGCDGDGSAATSATLTNPRAVAADGAGNLFIADLWNVRRVELSSGLIGTLAGSAPPALGDGGPATLASLAEPDFAIADPNGNVYIADSSAHRIRKVAPDGTISTFAGTGSVGFAGDGGPVPEGQLSFPSGMALDSGGNLYVADMRDHRVRKIAADGTIRTVAGTGEAGFTGDGRAATEARLNSPASVVLDAGGNLYISDTENFRIRRVDRDGVISTFAGSGVSGYDGDGADARRALIAPYHIALDGSGNLYIADTVNHRVRKVTQSGIISTVAGRGTAGFSGDGGAAVEAQLNRPGGIAVDAEGNLYVADGSNFRVRKISPSGVIVTVAGDGGTGPGGDNGPALAAQLTTVGGLSVDAAGNVYVADRRNNRLRKLTPAAGAAMPAGGRRH